MSETQVRNQADWVLTSPFKSERGEDGREFGRRPRRLAELRMYTLSWAIRIKPFWQRKASDPEILSKWRQEALDQQSPLEYDERMTEKMVDYVLAELAGYAKIADNARGIEYYDEENITESRLSFRVPTRQPEYHVDDNNRDCVYTLYGFVVKGYETRPDAFLPNQYQHCVSPFKLSDPSRPGHRKILAIFLVDPIKPIPSTTVVPPQQAEWAAEALQEAHQDSGSRAARLPQEVVDLVKGRLPTMTRKEAEEYRLAPMEERTVFVEKYEDTACGVRMNMCEH
ncbi:hypothetical protein MVEN_01980600 [Mycena venus]|uniref:Uncharacterized protein n=1 Tax=Mycena venus TaxID=2733690 RepID=A0A8H6XE44_9AGAR|nr:hypothetical protein MVEN_01980600 [Mycena venus]